MIKLGINPIKFACFSEAVPKLFEKNLFFVKGTGSFAVYISEGLYITGEEEKSGRQSDSGTILEASGDGHHEDGGKIRKILPGHLLQYPAQQGGCGGVRE